MNKRIHLLIFLISLQSVLINAQTNDKENALPKLDNTISESFLKETLSGSKPRMVFNKDIVEDLKIKIKTDLVIKNMYAAIKLNAYKILDEPLLERVQTGRRILDVSRTMLFRINLLGVVYLLEEDPLILKRIDQEVLAVCSFTDWNPSHYLDVAEMSMAVAFALDWTLDQLPKKTLRLAKNTLINKGIYPSWPEYGGKKQWWVNGRNNWNQVCHGGMIAASIAIADEDPGLATQTINRALDGLPVALSKYMPDGVYPEGPGYWNYGTSFSVATAAILETSLGSDFGIKNYPGFANSAIFKVMCSSPSGLYYNFSDCGDKRSRSGDNTLAWFAAKTGNGIYYEKDRFLIPSDEIKLDRFSGAALAWMSQYEEKPSKDLPNTWFGKGTNPIAVIKNEEGETEYYFAGKGGGGSLSHGNMDAGSFVFELDGVRWVIDPGVQPYHELEKTGFDLWGQCQDCERWKLLTKNNFGHSTITVNENLHKVDGLATMIDSKNGDKPEVTFNLTPTFNGQVKEATRRFLKNGASSLLIEDNIKINEETKSITWQLITRADVEISSSGAILRQDGKELHLNNLSHPQMKLNVVSLDPPPFKLDKQIKNLKRIELRIPISAITDEDGELNIRFSLTADQTDIAYSSTYLSEIKSELKVKWPKNRTINIVFHGHSVPAGFFKTPQVNTLSAYPNLILQKLKSIYPYAVVNVIVTAIGGENSVSGAARFQDEVLVHKPDVLFIDYGLNDRGPGLEKSYTAWSQMISEAKEQNIKVILLTPSPDQSVDYQNPDNELKKHTDQIIRLAKENQVGLVDSYKTFEFTYSDSEELIKYMSQVNHPNKKGHELIANEIIKWFK